MTNFSKTSSPDTWSNLARQSGADFHLADCASSQSHEKRLKALLRLPLEVGQSIFEVRCEAGTLSSLLLSSVRHIGFDWEADMIDLARQRRPAREFRVGEVDDLPGADWIVASGPFHYSRGWSKRKTAAALRTIWKPAARGVGITALRTPAADQLHYTTLKLSDLKDLVKWDQVHADQHYLSTACA